MVKVSSVVYVARQAEHVSCDLWWIAQDALSLLFAQPCRHLVESFGRHWGALAGVPVTETNQRIMGHNRAPLCVCVVKLQPGVMARHLPEHLHQDNC